VTQAPLDNVKVRQAIQYAIDRERIAKQVFGGLATPTTQFWDPTAIGYDASLDDEYAYDPEKAKELIKEAGAEGASFTINAYNLDPNVSAAQIVRNNLEAIGLDVTVTTVDVQTFATQQINANLGPSFMPLHGTNGYSPATLMNSMPSLKLPNPSHFDSTEYDSLRTALSTATGDDQVKATEALSKYIVQQAFSLPLVYAPLYAVTSSTLKGEKVTRRFYAEFASAYIGG
jgi:peptide/nickel transport system substrate-binding protein